MTRIEELLRAAASTYDEHSDPFNTQWLVDHDVTLDECMELSEQIATSIRVWLGMGDLIQLMAKTGKLAEESLAGAIANMGLAHYKAGVGAVLASSVKHFEPSRPLTYDCGTNTNCGRDDCVAHAGWGGDS